MTNNKNALYITTKIILLDDHHPCNRIVLFQTLENLFLSFQQFSVLSVLKNESNLFFDETTEGFNRSLIQILSKDRKRCITSPEN